MSAPVFLAPPAALSDAAAGDTVQLDGPEGRHAVSVRRLRPGEDVHLTDGAGRTVEGVVASLDGRDRLVVQVVHVRTDPPPAPRLVLAQALAKGDRGELAVETATEIGVDEVLPWTASRCVVQWRGDRAAKGVARWRATAQEAAKQSRRSWFPVVSEPVGTAALAERVAGAALAVVLHEEAEQPLAGLAVPDDGDVLVVVGPEGGIAPEELQELEAAGALVCRLGATVLRTSTAGAAALAVLSAASRWR